MPNRSLHLSAIANLFGQLNEMQRTLFLFERIQQLELAYLSITMSKEVAV